jgi:hypothetical protein
MDPDPVMVILAVPVPDLVTEPVPVTVPEGETVPEGVLLGLLVTLVEMLTVFDNEPEPVTLTVQLTLPEPVTLTVIDTLPEPDPVRDWELENEGEGVNDVETVDGATWAHAAEIIKTRKRRKVFEGMFAELIRPPLKS